MNSIVFKAKLLGLFTGLLLSAMAYFAFEFVVNYSKAREITKSILVYKALKKSEHTPAYLKAQNIQRLNEKEAKAILKKAKYVIETPIYREVFQSGDIALYRYKDYYYYCFKVGRQTFYYKNLESADNYILYLFLISCSLILLLFLIYAYIVKALRPLKSLHQKIKSLAHDTKGVSKQDFGRNVDEVAEVSKAFDEAVARIETLERTRTLFWRNIMHELKTPLTQGKLMVHVLEAKQEDKEALLGVFDKMQAQLDELKQLEYLKEEHIQLEVKETLMIDIIDNVLDILGLEEDAISYLPDAQKYKLNFNLFSIALKNLIANAIHYSSDKKVYLRHKNAHLYIINAAEPLEESFDTYTQAFVRNEAKQGGMGLGLYISKGIFNKHNIRMQHRYLKGKHLIILDMQSTLS